jgi:hypothetical protein
MGFQTKPRGLTALHKCRKSDSQIFELLKPLKLSRNFGYRAIKRYKVLWGAEDRQCNNQNNNICAQTSLEVHSEGAGMPSPFLRHG